MKNKKIYNEYDSSSGTSIGLEYEKYLHQSQSKYQNIEIIKTQKYGNAMYLNGCFMLTEKNQDFYHNECLNLVPKKAKNILIIGGGDFAIASMVSKKRTTKKVTIVEIDDQIIKISKKYFPKYFKHNKKQKECINLVINDGMLFLNSNKEKFDCIIIDSTDPVNESKILITLSFLKKCFCALDKEGVIIQQSGSPLKDMTTIIKPLSKKYLKIGFKNIILSSFPMPLYPTGTWSFITAKRA
tara:strand:- start:1527 stop:2249 length:723 start_codon:yes stop_codon:yes gene_type:complete